MHNVPQNDHTQNSIPAAFAAEICFASVTIPKLHALKGDGKK